jgi:hypothetical protein
MQQTPFETAQTAWDSPTAANPGRAAPQPTANGAKQGPPQPIPTTKWGALELFAARAEAAVAIEREVAQIFDRRSSLVRRITDATKRKDEEMVTNCARDWITSEVRLSKLFEAYRPIMAERAKTLEALGAT